MHLAQHSSRARARKLLLGIHTAHSSYTSLMSTSSSSRARGPVTCLLSCTSTVSKRLMRIHSHARSHLTVPSNLWIGIAQHMACCGRAAGSNAMHVQQAQQGLPVPTWDEVVCCHQVSQVRLRRHLSSCQAHGLQEGIHSLHSSNSNRSSTAHRLPFVQRCDQKRVGVRCQLVPALWQWQACPGAAQQPKQQDPVLLAQPHSPHH